MESQYLAGKDWAVFEKLFPNANGWLIGATLRNELQSLSIDEEHGWLTPYKKKRLVELLEWNKTDYRNGGGRGEQW